MVGRLFGSVDTYVLLDPSFIYWKILALDLISSISGKDFRACLASPNQLSYNRTPQKQLRKAGQHHFFKNLDRHDQLYGVVDLMGVRWMLYMIRFPEERVQCRIVSRAMEDFLEFYKQ